MPCLYRDFGLSQCFRAVSYDGRMPRIMRVNRVQWHFVFVSVAAIVCGSSLAGAKDFPADVQSQLDQAIQRTRALNVIPGLIVKIRSPKGNWNKTYGFRDTEKLLPMRANDSLRIGSNTKTFTGTAVLILQDQGKLKITDPISKYLSDIPNGDNITIEMLGNMSSGLASYTFSESFQNAMFTQTQKVWTPNELLRSAFDQKPSFEPGKGWQYCNTNTVILGELIVKVTGKPVPQVFKELIFDPLGLQHTLWPTNGDMPEPFARGYTLQGVNDSLKDATNWNPSWGYTAGQLVSNMEDLLTWAKALGTGKLLSRASWDQRQNYAKVPPNTATDHYGFAMGFSQGWAGHTGTLPGYNTSCFYFAKEDISVVVGVNTDIGTGPALPAPAIIHAIAGVLTPNNLPKY